jgi:spore coat protein CotH
MLSLIFRSYNFSNLKAMKFKSLLLLLLPLAAVAQTDPGDTLFASSHIHEVRISFSQPSYWDSLTAYYTIDKMMSATVSLDGVILDSTGVEFKGNSSYTGPGVKKSFKIAFDEFREDQKCAGLKKINLHNSFKDPTMMREKIMLDFLNEYGIAAPRCTYAKLYINNAYWGLYTLVEQVNKPFLKDHYSDNDGNLFKGDPQGSLQWLGSSASFYYSKYELKTNETENDWSDLVRFIDRLNNTSSTILRDSLEQILNTESFLKYWAATITFVNLDSYMGSGHNYYIYHNLSHGRFEWIAWDVNEAFGNFNMGMNLTQIEALPITYVPSPGNNRPLMSKMLNDSYYFSRYKAHLCNMMTNYFRSDLLDPKIDSIANRIRADVYADPNKQYTNQQFESNITTDMGPTAGLKPFIVNRRQNLLGQVNSSECLNGINEKEEASVLIYPNPSTGEFNINTSVKDPIFKLYSVNGAEIAFKLIRTNENTYRITDVGQTGMLILMINDGKNILIKKLQKF